MIKPASTSGTWWREQRGSYVAQTAGIALFVTVVVTLLLGAMPGMQARVQHLLNCEIAKYSGGGRCGGGGSPDGNVGPASGLQSYHNAPINQAPQPVAAGARPVDDAPDPAPARRCAEGLLAATGGTTVGTGGSTRAQAAPAPASCDARCQLLGFLDRIGEWWC